MLYKSVNLQKDELKLMRRNIQQINKINIFENMATATDQIDMWIILGYCEISSAKIKKTTWLKYVPLENILFDFRLHIL